MNILPQRQPTKMWQRGMRITAAVLFCAAGANHFIKPDFYRKIVPPGFPAPGALVAISGVAEVAGGIGLLVRPVRRAAGWGLIALLIAVFPANIFMAVAPEQAHATQFPRWALWLRLPLQVVMIAWVWFCALAGEKRSALPAQCESMNVDASASTGPSQRKLAANDSTTRT